MKTLREVPPTLVERDGDGKMPPGGGLAIVVIGSILFWSAMLWIVLR